MIDPRLLERKRLLFDASVHEAAGRHEEAVAWYRKALEAGDPDPRIYHLLAVACRRSGLFNAAEEALSAAMAIAGQTSTLLAEQAELAAARGMPDKAHALMQRAARGDHPDPDILLRCAELALDDGDAAGAVMASIRASTAGANAAPILARACLRLGDLPAAALSAVTAYDAEPGNPAIAGLMASIRVRQGRLEDALNIATKAGGEATELMADAFKDIGDPSTAFHYYDAALPTRPDDADLGFNRATALLAAGRIEDGFAAYECRWQRPGKTMRPFTPPRWQGEDLAGKHLLVWTEQGLGEEVLHLRALGNAAEQASKVTVETTDRLVPLVARAFPDITVIPRQNPPHAAALDPGIELQCPAADLVRHLGAAPMDGVSLLADQHRRDTLSRRYRVDAPGLLAGICWSTERTPAAASKSIPTPLLAPILRIPGIDWVSLQFGEAGKAEIRRLEARTGRFIRHDPEIDPLRNLDDSAAQIDALDIVISISTTAAHLAGALGKDVRVVLNSRPLWHWGAGTETCRWYPSARLYRQPEPGDWATPLAALRRDLEKMVETAASDR